MGHPSQRAVPHRKFFSRPNMPVPAFVATLVVLGGFALRRLARDAGLRAFVPQHVPEPVGIIAQVRQQPFRLWQTAQPGHLHVRQPVWVVHRSVFFPRQAYAAGVGSMGPDPRAI